MVIAHFSHDLGEDGGWLPPVGKRQCFAPAPGLEPDTRLRLSRFAYTRRSPGAFHIFGGLRAVLEGFLADVEPVTQPLRLEPHRLGAVA